MSPGPPALTIERAVQGTPHQGKVLALVTPHLDDGPIFAFGTIAKLLREGYTGYFIRTSNDEKDSYDLTVGETVLANERDHRALVQATGLKKVFDLGYRNHRMDDVSRIEIARAADLSVPPAEGRYGFQLRSLGTITRKIPIITSPRNRSRRPAGWPAAEKIFRNISRPA